MKRMRFGAMQPSPTLVNVMAAMLLPSP